MTQPKAARISPDSRLIAYGAAGLASAIYLGAFATSFFGQASLAQHMLIPSQLQFVAPAVVDLALILFTLATLVRRSRGESTLITNLATAGWTMVSIVANIFHVLIPAGRPESWSAGTYAGATLSALMPLAALGASLVIENVLIARPGAEQAGMEDTNVAAPGIASKGASAQEPSVARIEPESAATGAGPSPVQDASRRKEELPVFAKALTVPAARQVQGLATAVTSPPPAAPPVDWDSLTKAERASLIHALKDEGLSFPKISDLLGVSLSTVKRFRADLEERRLQPS